MKKIIALGGSNSSQSINKALATYAASLTKNTEINILDLNNFDLPLYGYDLETKLGGAVDDAKKLNTLLEMADGIIISLAEHNSSYTTAFKNAFDWLSRIDKKVWKNKPMLLMATSPGARGGASVLDSAKNAFPYYGGNIVASFSLPQFYDNFSENKISDTKLNDSLLEKIKLFE